MQACGINGEDDCGPHDPSPKLKTNPKPKAPGKNTRRHGGEAGEDVGGTGNGFENEIEFTIWGNDEKCESDSCQNLATGIGMVATAFDTTAFILNGAFAIAADGLLIAGGIPGYAYATAAYVFYSKVSNTFGTIGGLLWLAQGVVLGDNYLEAGMTYTTAKSGINVTGIRISGSLSQDTIAAGFLDGVGWAISDPNLGAAFSTIGLVYDVGRNPLSPALSSTPPFIPTIFQPSFDASYSFTTNFPSIRFSFSP